MDFFNKAKEKIAKTSGDVAKKAKDLTEIAKLNSQISTNEAQLRLHIPKSVSMCMRT